MQDAVRGIGAVARVSAAAALCLAAQSMLAAVNLWQGGVSSDFNTSANWSLGALATSDVSTFPGLAVVQPNVSADITVAQLNFPGTNYTVSATGDAALTLTASPAIVSLAREGTNTVSADIVLAGGGSRTIQQAGNGTLWIAGDIAEAASGTAIRYERTSAAGGRYVITGQNTYGGETTFADGTFTVATFGMAGSASSVGTNGTVNVGSSGSSRDASLVYAGAGETTDRTLRMGAGSGARSISTLGATGPLVLSGGVVPNGTADLPKLTFSGDSLGNVLHGAIPDPSSSTTTTVTKAGTGSWTFAGANSYKGMTKVDAGTLLVNGDQTAATGLVTVAASATLGGKGTVGGIVSLSGTLAPGDASGALTMARDLLVKNGAKVAFEAGDAVAVAGLLDLDNNWTLKLGDGFQDGGSVVLFTYGSLATSPDLVPTFDTTGLGFTPSGALSLTDTGTSIVLNGVRLPFPGTTVLIVR